MKGSSGFMSSAESRMAMCCSAAIRARSSTISAAERMSRFASGSSSNDELRAADKCLGSHFTHNCLPTRQVPDTGVGERSG